MVRFARVVAGVEWNAVDEAVGLDCVVVDGSFVPGRVHCFCVGVSKVAGNEIKFVVNWM